MSFPSNKGLAQIEEEFAIDAGEEADAYSKLSNLLSVSLPMIFETLETGASDENLRDRGGGEKKGKREDPWEKAFSIFLTDSLIYHNDCPMWNFSSFCGYWLIYLFYKALYQGIFI